LSRPFHTTTVDVVEGTTDPVELTTGEASLVKDNGFSIETDDEGFLVVSTVDGKGSAAANGLEAGDTVVGVSMGGVSLNEMVPGMSEEITDAVLDHWGGPGVSLLVDRDGTEVVVPMD
jgi:S1-C subfamily serine protease